MTTWNRKWMFCMLHAVKRMLQCSMLVCNFVACSALYSSIWIGRSFIFLKKGHFFLKCSAIVSNACLPLRHWRYICFKKLDVVETDRISTTIIFRPSQKNVWLVFIFGKFFQLVVYLSYGHVALLFFKIRYQNNCYQILKQ